MYIYIYIYIYIYTQKHTKIKGVPQQKSSTLPTKNWRPENDDLQGWVYQILHPEPRETRRSEASDHHRNTKSTEALVKNYDYLDIPVSKKLLGYNLLIYGVYWGYNPFANHLLTSWDIQVGMVVWFKMRKTLWVDEFEHPPKSVICLSHSWYEDMWNNKVSKCENGKIYVYATVYAYKFPIYKPSIKSCIMSTFSSEQGCCGNLSLSIRGSLVAHT